MSEPPFADTADTAGAAPVELPITLQAFQRIHADAYFDYTYACLGDADLAQKIVTEAFIDLADCWDRVLTHRRPAATAWAALRHLVEVTREHRERLDERVAFSIALRLEWEPFLDDLDAITTGVDGLEAGMALGAAIKDLPAAKFDVIVLRFVVGLGVTAAAQAMGIDEGTVKSLTTQARNKLEARLRSRRLLRPSSTRKDQERL
ncbi:sigma factor-like helix-turn-helix DNA-binding protein [Kitasatospora sp. NPDC094019]|uniref:sigma factor-like helix-turn-helix DNA-binding protein n=1 Tax=Kitasatospora sp. NPDC094019 TaxID=3364091 RepID=UPI0037FC44D2